jgi:Ca2+-binding RTX toxin-like protein
MTFNDGSASASAGAPQHSTLLDSYGANRPAWEVAGVDYHVGVPAGLALRDPATISMAGVSVNTSTRTITVTGNNVTLDGYNFALNGGWGVNIQGSNTTILNSNFEVGANNNTPIYGLPSAGNITVRYCTIDGNRDPDIGGLVVFRGTGTVTVEHSWLFDAGSDMVQVHTEGRAAGLVLQYNLIENAGMAPGAHGDYTQFMGGPYSATINYNTTIQNGGTTQGFMVEPDVGSEAGVIVSGEIGNNVFTATDGINVFTGVTVPDIVNSFTVHDNYFDPRGTLVGLSVGGIRGGENDSSSRTVYVHNVNMVNGSVEQDSNAPTTPTPAPTPTPVGSVLLGDANANTIYAGAGNDQMAGNDGNDTLSGNAGNDVIAGGNGNDGLLGGEGFDFIAGGAGDDAIMGQNGNDMLWGDDNSGGVGNDGIDGGDGNDTIIGQGGNDTIVGGTGNDAIAGGDGVDMLYGHAGADIIFGGNGADLITGGAGADVLRGEGGGDLFVFNFGDNGDLIQGFNQGGVRDGLDLRGYFNATGYTGTNPLADGIMNVVQSGVDADVYLNGAFAFRIEGVTAAAIDNSYVISQ